MDHSGRVDFDGIAIPFDLFSVEVRSADVCEHPLAGYK